MGYQPWDLLVFDGEHGNIEYADCENMVRAAELRDITPIVRVPNNQPHIILRYMDTGVQGLHVPWVNSAAEAEQVVRSVKYHPRGIRGLAVIPPAHLLPGGVPWRRQPKPNPPHPSRLSHHVTCYSVPPL